MFYSASTRALADIVSGGVNAASSRPVDPNKAIRVARFFSYPAQVLYLLASFIFLISLCHFISLGHRYATRNRACATQYGARTPASLLRLPVALADSLKTIAFRWTVPVGGSFTLNLAEVGLTLGYIGVLFSWAFVNTTTTTGVKVEPHYYANRAGTIAASQVPIMTALGMRNNLLSWLTGVSFDKLNYLHRMSGRVICILVWIHAGGRMTIGLLDDEALVNQWVQCGLLSATALTLMIALTIRPIRERKYELFLLIHFIFAFIFILSLFFHLTGRSLTYYGAWPSMIIWGFDRLLRLIQLAAYNFSYLNPFSSRASTKALDASVEVLSSDFVKLTLRRPAFRWRAGQSAFVSFPSVAAFPLESHPFTIASINDAAPGSEATSDKRLTFILRVRSGFTKRLSEVASLEETYPVVINGPYSSPPILVGYQSVILIAGGSGVAFTLPLLLDVISRAKRGEKSCQKVIFLWAVRDIACTQWLEEPLSVALKDLPSSLSVQISVYNTSASTSPSSTALSEQWDDSPTENASSGSGMEKALRSGISYSNLLESPCITIVQGRPSITSLLTEEISNTSGRISINVCGTHALAATVREAIRIPRTLDILRGGPTVSLYVEGFGG